MPPPGVEVDRVQPRGEDHAAEAGHRPGDHEDDHPDVPHVDARATGRLGVPADRVDVTAEGRALRDPRPEDEQHDHEQERDREAALLVRPVDDAERDRREADDLQRDEHEVVREDPVSPATDHPRQRRDHEQAGRDRRDDVAGGVREEVVRDVVDQRVVDHDHALVADRVEDHALPEQEAGERDDERRHADDRDEAALEDPDQGGDERPRSRSRRRRAPPSSSPGTGASRRRRRRCPRRSRSRGRSRRAGGRRRRRSRSS